MTKFRKDVLKSLAGLETYFTYYATAEAVAERIERVTGLIPEEKREEAKEDLNFLSIFCKNLRGEKLNTSKDHEEEQPSQPKATAKINSDPRSLILFNNLSHFFDTFMRLDELVDLLSDIEVDFSRLEGMSDDPSEIKSMNYESIQKLESFRKILATRYLIEG